jgi:hypothetical protein
MLAALFLFLVEVDKARYCAQNPRQATLGIASRVSDAWRGALHESALV